MEIRSKGKSISSPQKWMVFLLAMVLFGLTEIVSELIPTLKFGTLKIGIAYFSFIPLTLCMLLHPLHAALGACTGEIVFGDILMGDFSGISEFERFIELFIGMYIAGRLVRNPKNRTSVIYASLIGVGIDRTLSCLVDIVKLWIGTGHAADAAGLAVGAIPLEIISNVIDLIITGFLFGVLPTLYLISRLHGKLEPLLGMEPRNSSSLLNRGQRGITDGM